MAARTLTLSRDWRLPLALSGGLILALAAGAVRAENIVSHGITTFGDPLKYGPEDVLAYVNPEAPKGGEFSLATFGTFDTFNPYTDKGNGAALATIGYEDMMTGTADEVGALYCQLCKSIEYPADKSWVIFTLREGITFSDGSPLTAEDVKFTHDIFAREGLLSFRTILQEFVASAEVLGPLQIKYTFKPESAPRERIQMAGGLPVMSKAWFEKTGAKLDETRMDPGIGSGPYLLDRFEAGKRVIYKRNPNWWGANLPMNRGRNNFDSIRVEYFGDPTAAFEGFKAGEFLFRNENSSKNWATAYEFDAVKKGWVVKAELTNGRPANGQAFVMNLRREKFADPRVREALGLMFNFEWSNQTLFYGIYARINSFGENSEMKAEGLPSPEELAVLEPLKDKLPPAVFTEPPPVAPASGATQLDRGNLRKASALLDDAGWPAGDDGKRRNAKGEVLAVEFLTDDPAFDRVNNPYIENLVALGVSAKLNRVDPAQYEALSRKHDFDIITDQLSLGLEPGAGLMQVFGSKGKDDVFNSSGLADPAVDAIIEQILRAETRPDLVTRTRALDRVLRHLRFVTPQWFKDKHTVAYYDVFGHPETLPPYALGEMDFWWYDAEKAAKLRAAGGLK